MRYAPYLLLLVALVTLSPLPAPAQDAPLFEARGVWFATSLADGGWPERGPGDTPAEQARDLRARIQAAHALGLNTFVFQAIGQGDALYRSDRLPWSPIPTGPGMDPGYDPLQVAIDEAHRLGMELHVWINTFFLGDEGVPTTFAGVTDPQHVVWAQPSWTERVGNSMWLNPGVPEARDWMVGNVVELVDRYDLDALHFDYIRYPQGTFVVDQNLFLADPRGHADIGDWRRENVTLFLEAVRDSVRARKPWVTLGAAPISNYQRFDGAWPAMWGYSDVYQASQEWLEDGLLDYAAPQIYFTVGRTPEPGTEIDSPDFIYLVEDWVEAADARAVFVGMAPYKDIVREEIVQQIDLSRQLGAEGQVFFRYDHTLGLDLQGRYATPSLPPLMDHRPEATAPPAPEVFSVQPLAEGAVVNWLPSVGTAEDPLRAYAIFRREGAPPSTNSARDLAAVVDAGTTSWVDLTASADLVYYAVVAQSRLGLPSPPSATINTAGVTAAEAPETPPEALRLTGLYPAPARTQATLTFATGTTAPVTLTLIDALGRRVRQADLGWRTPGTHRHALSVSGLAAGIYLVQLDAGTDRVLHRLVVAR